MLPLDLGVTGDANSMRINHQALRITATSKLNTHAKTWRITVHPSNPGSEDTDAEETSE